RSFRLTPAASDAQGRYIVSTQSWRGADGIRGKSSQKLKPGLDGNTYDAGAREPRLSRSAVQQRALARDLQRIVGVECVNEDEVPPLVGMRARGLPPGSARA